MHLPPFHERLVTERESLQWRQCTLCDKTEIDSSRMSRLESGTRYPTTDEWQRLAALLDIGPYQPPPPAPKAHHTWKADSPLLSWTSDKTLPQRLYAARSAFGPRVDEAHAEVAAREDFEAVEHFLNRASLDSAYEYHFWLILLTRGALPRWYSPLKAGFRAHSIVDCKKGHVAGDLRHPCLLTAVAGAQLLLFSQVTVVTRKGEYRLDALVCVKLKGVRIWVDIEIDGGGHNPTFDRKRQRALGLPTLRFNTADLNRADFFELFEERIADLIKAQTRPK